jgi:uncharacterized protein YcnI
MSSRTRRWMPLGAALVVAASLAWAALPAAAHVEIDPDSAPKGASQVFSFRVPNEEPNASTVELDVQLPTNHPIPTVLVQPKPGWTFSVTTKKLAKPIKTPDGTVTDAVDTITWKGGSIPPGGFDLFTVFAEPLPTNTSKLVFKAVQTYSNGDVVRWIELPAKGAPEPEHPAPTLILTKAVKGG